MMENDTDMKRTHQAVAVAQEYDALMGLVTVFLGAGLLMGAATGRPGFWVVFGGVVGLLSTNWYYRRFGYVRMRMGRLWRYVAGIIVGVVIVGAALRIDEWLAPPVSVTLLAVALVAGVGDYLMLRRVGLTPVHWAGFGMLVIASAAPLFGVGSDGFDSPFVLSVIGVVMVAIGLTDHLRLVRIMGSAPESDTNE